MIQNGIRMTGMPAFGPTHTDEQIWNIVAFLRRMHELSPEQYAQMVAAAGLSAHEGETGEAGEAGRAPGDGDGGARTLRAAPTSAELTASHRRRAYPVHRRPIGRPRSPWPA